MRIAYTIFLLSLALQAHSQGYAHINKPASEMGLSFGCSGDSLVIDFAEASPVEYWQGNIGTGTYPRIAIGFRAIGDYTGKLTDRIAVPLDGKVRPGFQPIHIQLWIEPYVFDVRTTVYISNP